MAADKSPPSPAFWAPGASLSALQDRGEALGLTREFFADRQVLEVQTPLLGAATVTDPSIQALQVSANTGVYENSETSSGASGTSFLQTSTEYHQKRLLAAGVGDNYTLGPVFRAEEQGRLHNPEFIMLEWYRLGFDDRRLMAEVSELVDLLLGPAPYATISYGELLASATLSASEQRDLPPASHADLRVVKALDALGAGRRFVVDYPADEAVLAQLDGADPRLARRFELIVDGVELANGYFELTDPEVHRERFAADQRRRTEQGLSAVVADQRFLAAIDAGLPDCAGVALGFDRLLQLRQGAKSLADVQTFDWDRR